MKILGLPLKLGLKSIQYGHLIYWTSLLYQFTNVEQSWCFCAIHTVLYSSFLYKHTYHIMQCPSILSCDNIISMMNVMHGVSMMLCVDYILCCGYHITFGLL
jgi:hypothetical protein